MHLKLEVLAVLPQWCLGKLKEAVHLRQTHSVCYRFGKCGHIAKNCCTANGSRQ